MPTDLLSFTKHVHSCYPMQCNLTGVVRWWRIRTMSRLQRETEIPNKVVMFMVSLNESLLFPIVCFLTLGRYCVFLVFLTSVSSTYIKGSQWILVEWIKLLFLCQIVWVFPILYLVGNIALESESNEFDFRFCNYYMILSKLPDIFGPWFPHLQTAMHLWPVMLT